MNVLNELLPFRKQVTLSEALESDYRVTWAVKIDVSAVVRRGTIIELPRREERRPTTIRHDT
jgi:hypothetical protein